MKLIVRQNLLIIYFEIGTILLNIMLTVISVNSEWEYIFISFIAILQPSVNISNTFIIINMNATSTIIINSTSSTFANKTWENDKGEFDLFEHNKQKRMNF